jgi:hypothetical protein
VENEILKSKNGSKAMGDTSASSFYEVIGRLAIVFSRLEYLTEYVLTLMIAKNDFMVEPLLIRPLNFYRKIEMIKKCIDYHFDNGLKNNDKHKALFSKIDNIRALRNSLIHGDWVIDEYEKKGYLTVLNYKLKYQEKENYWTDLKQDRYTVDKLNEMHKEVQEIIKEIEFFLPEYEKLNTRPWLDTASPEDLAKFKEEVAKLISEET